MQLQDHKNQIAIELDTSSAQQQQQIQQQQTIASLEKQLTDMKKESIDLSEHKAAIVTKDHRIAELETQLATILAGNSVNNNEYHRRGVMDTNALSDAKRVRDIEEVGHHTRSIHPDLPTDRRTTDY